MVDPCLLDEARLSRLSSITNHLKLTQSFSLLKVTEIPPVGFNNLRTAVIYYVFSNLSQFYKNEKFELCDDILDRYSEQIRGLPNITPGGVVLPKKQTQLEYNLVHGSMARIFKPMFSSVLESIHAPINIRVVDGVPNSVADKRPRSSTKVHSDIWAGEPMEAMMVFCPIFGDMKGAGVSFFEPKTFPQSLAQPLNDYLDGAFLLERVLEYRNVAFSEGNLLITDPFLLHQTIKSSNKLRLSIDFRFIPKQKIKSDTYFKSPRLKNYISLDDWCDYGIGRLITTESQQETFKNIHVLKNDYPSSFKTIKIT